MPSTMGPRLEGWLKRIVGKIQFLNDDQRELLAVFLRTFCRDFILAWAIRGGVGFLPHLLKLLRFRGFNLTEAIKLSFGVTAGRFGLFMALYFAIFKTLEKICSRLRGKCDSLNAAIAGSIASFSLMVETEDTRWVIAQYLLVRALATAWSNIQTKHPKLNKYTYYGDSLLFALCSGQAVYCYVVRPDTVDPSYASFLTKVTQMSPLLIELFRSRMRTGQLDGKILQGIIDRMPGQIPEYYLENQHTHINCSLIHPGMGCLERILWILYANFKSVFPMYFSLHLVPPLLFKYRVAFKNFHQTLKIAMKNGIQSSAFMSTYVFIFQIILCLQRKLMDLGMLSGGEWRYSFWWMGFFSAASIFIEKKQRRAELALYMLSRSGVSLYRALIEKGWARNVKYGEMLMFGAAMGVLMKAFRKDERQLSSIVARVIKQFLY